MFQTRAGGPERKDGMGSMVLNISFWKLREDIRESGQADQAVQVMQASLQTLQGIEGLCRAELGRNLAGGPYDVVCYIELADMAALERFRDHPLHLAHRERCAPFITSPMQGVLNLETPG